MKNTTVPNILTSKDTDYLQDAFNWNYGAFKMCENAISNIKAKELEKVLKKASKCFKNNMQELLKIMEDYVNENK